MLLNDLPWSGSECYAEASSDDYTLVHNVVVRNWL